MLLVMLVAFIVTSVILEMMITKHIPKLGYLAGRYKLIGIGLSVGLSWVLGQLFAAGGMVVLIGSIAGSVLTQPLHWWRVNKARIEDQLLEAVRRFVSEVTGWVRPARQLHLQAGKYRASAWGRCCHKGRIYTGWSWNKDERRRP